MKEKNNLSLAKNKNKIKLNFVSVNSTGYKNMLEHNFNTTVLEKKIICKQSDCFL